MLSGSRKISFKQKQMDICICVFRNTSNEVDADGICGENTEEVAISEEDLRFSIRFC